MLIRPPFLRSGDKVRVIATARYFNTEDLVPGLSILRDWGLQVSTGKFIDKQHQIFAGKDEERLEDIQDALNDTDLKAIFFARGGYGTTRIIDRIDFSDFKNQPKWLVGYSDITALHMHVQNLGFQSIHAIMPLTFSKKGSESSVVALHDMLFGNRVIDQIPSSPLNRTGTATGTIIGGNLSLLNNIIGTASDLSYDNKILFIEDIGEYLYHLDRMMIHLKRCGKLEKLSGLIVGHMTDMKDGEIPFGQTAQEIIAHAVADKSFPVAFNFPSGHETLNMPIRTGAEVKLIVDNEVSLEYIDQSETSILT